jgi:hypothetical protein
MERGCYFLRTLPPEPPREPEDEPRDADPEPREEEPREAPLDLPDDEDPTRPPLVLPDEPLDRPEKGLAMDPP